MHSAIAPAFAARGSERQRMLARVRVAVMLASTFVTLSGCGGSGATAPAERTVDTSTPVGTWIGSLDGGEGANSYGPSELTMTLKADSTLTVKTTNPKYCALGITIWRVTGGNFTASGRDCDNVVVTFAAPVTALRLTGTWTASSGRAGGFSVAKQ